MIERVRLRRPDLYSGGKRFRPIVGMGGNPVTVQQLFACIGDPRGRGLLQEAACSASRQR
ncbi:hypothetical protein [Methylobacterium sp. WL64]|uniref:hypothetical protein n=1 Tax=Methylobacterium sp. WL64 TaxID=2603894 RepID=UPI00164F49C5|nr:hypothetical protein [Methylobacterium sp. WL64]